MADNLLEVAIETGASAIAPGVGTLLCLVTRKALAKNDEKRLRAHLINAMKLGEANRADLPQYALIRRGRGWWGVRRARGRAGKDFNVLGKLDEQPQYRPAVEPDPPEDHELVTGTAQGSDEREFQSIPFLVKAASGQLRDALERADLATWTSQLYDQLTAYASDQLKRGASDWALIVTNDEAANPKDVAAVDIAGWSEAVTLRFEIGLAGDPAMQPWVARLDTHDKMASEQEMVSAARGIRVALLLIALALLVVLPAAVALEHFY